MRIKQIAAAACLASALALCACENNSETVPKADYDLLLQEYAEVKAGAEAAREESVAQAQAIDNILRELSLITGQTISLRTDVEHGTARLTQVEQIESSITQIKSRIARLESLSRESESLRRLVSSLREVISAKEAEIETLKAEIQSRDSMISAQSDTISAHRGTIVMQNETITRQQDNLRAAFQEQAQMLFRAGEDFETLGDNAPDVSGRRDRNKVKEYAREMYMKATFYYSKALESGYPEASYRMDRVREKMDRL